MKKCSLFIGDETFLWPPLTMMMCLVWYVDHVEVMTCDTATCLLTVCTDMFIIHIFKYIPSG